MFFKVIYQNIILDILKNPTWVRWLKKSGRFISSDIVSANGVISSDKQSVYNIAARGVFENAREAYKSVTLVEIPESEYNDLNTKMTDSALNRSGEVVSLEMARADKSDELRAECEKSIVHGFDIILPDGLRHHFSLDVYDQMRIAKLREKALAGDTDLSYHADGEVCRYFPAEDIIAIYEKTEQTIAYHTAYFNSLKLYLNNVFNVKTVIGLTYGDSIPADCQSEVLKAMKKPEQEESR